MATVADIREDGENKTFTMRSEIAEELRIDQSISHNGVCLTVESIANDTYTVTAIYETLIKSNLGLLRPGDRVNIERSMRPDALLDGHIVQGHVDQTAPYTYEHTNFKDIRPGSVVNIEFDIIGKYIARLMKGYTEGR